MTSPDAIHDTALLTVSAWQRETSQQMASCEIGRGRTEREAIDDLMAQIEERFA